MYYTSSHSKSLLISVVILLGLCFFVSACNSSNHADEPALGVPIPEFNSTDDVRAYVQAIINAPHVPGYILPEGIIAEDYNTSNENLNALYPEFYGKHGGNLLDAVEAHPYRYQEMIRDVMALRDHFNPEWRDNRQ